MTNGMSAARVSVSSTIEWTRGPGRTRQIQLSSMRNGEHSSHLILTVTINWPQRNNELHTCIERTAHACNRKRLINENSFFFRIKKVMRIVRRNLQFIFHTICSTIWGHNLLTKKLTADRDAQFISPANSRLKNGSLWRKWARATSRVKTPRAWPKTFSSGIENDSHAAVAQHKIVITASDCQKHCAHCAVSMPSFHSCLF